ncbi:helix-turn-helix domain-containing protein [Halobacillus sp. BAB-2008]|uniref:PucR family transcriptional regulator n=1 Tax=Halobacillus sp. BAB-2008 TaxID=1246484 RepID=UPI0002A4D217|nr:helix-turn-helix domain-containing protein [Halobacillus sp. BAB-2008]ELK47642.1 hypothetical protein D479_06070 [Halobacillus sp. BAB-2008]
MTIIDQLTRIYPSILLQKPKNRKEAAKFQWFTTEDGDLVGIDKAALHDKEADLLSIFLTPINEKHGEPTREAQWRQILKGQDKAPDFHPPRAFRFLIFSIKDTTPDKESIQEAFQSLFPEEVPILWKNNREGMIIEEVFQENQELLTLEGIPDILMSDLYTDIRFYVSDTETHIQDARTVFLWSERAAAIAADYHLGPVVSSIEILPYLFLDSLNREDWNYMKRTVFSDMDEEKELLDTIRVFLESGSNTTLAAKKLYMHRNSLQYRVDKFIERTGLDVKKFEVAVPVYLALLQMEQ